MSTRPNTKKLARASVPLLGVLLLSVGQFSRAADIPPLPDLPALPDQKEWDAAIEKFSQDRDPKVAANRRLVMEAELEFAKALRYGHVRQVFVHYMAPQYVQHNPNIAPGREGIIHSFESGAAPPDIKPKPGEKPHKNSAIPTLVVAEGDYVALVFEVELPDPKDSSKTYIYDPTTIFRIEHGQIVEHWGGPPKGAM
jgi:predicted SnoaL-like aldol condensation-catalyzing enzyme